MEKKKKEDKYYLPRDISWMYFNRRILQEAMKERVPILERLSFLGIYSNNLDEFFRVRVATQSRVAECEDKAAHSEREEALKLIRQINKLNNRYSKEYEGAIKQVTAELEKENICLVNHVQLDEEQQLFVDSFYQQRLNGFISPVWLKSVKQLGNEADENIFLAVKMRKEGHKVGEYAIIELPVAQAGRFIRLPDKDGKNYLMYLDDVVRYCLPLIFHGMNYKHFEAYAFKFTKDAEMEIDNDLRNGMMQKISKGVKSRKRGEPLRVIYDANMPKDLLKRVMNKLNLDKLDTVLGGGKYHNHKDLMRFPDCGRKDLKYPEWTPVLKNELSGNVGMLELIRRKDRFIHVPYHSFDSYIRILQEAAINKEVKSIKTTLYRLAKDSKVVKALINAARNGKKVTVVIELLARFDEASNIDWSKKMQDAGIRVITAVNIQHIEGLNEMVQDVVGIEVKERIPDIVLEQADEVVNIDLTADELLARLKAGKIYKPDKIQTALNNFFKAEHILQLRELALKEVALRVEKKVENTIPENLGVRHERFMACISSNEKTPRKIIRKVARLATRYNSKFFVLYVQTPRESSDRIPLASQRHLLNHFKLATELGGEIIQVQSPHITDAIVQACKEKQISTLCIGRPALKYPSAILAMVHYRNMLEELAQLGIDLIILA